LRGVHDNQNDGVSARRRFARGPRRLTKLVGEASRCRRVRVCADDGQAMPRQVCGEAIANGAKSDTAILLNVIAADIGVTRKTSQDSAHEAG